MIAERLRSRIQTHSYTGSLKGLNTTASMGVATYPTDFITSVADLIREADEAMYRAKDGRQKQGLFHEPGNSTGSFLLLSLSGRSLIQQ